MSPSATRLAAVFLLGQILKYTIDERQDTKHKARFKVILYYINLSYNYATNRVDSIRLHASQTVEDGLSIRLGTNA